MITIGSLSSRQRVNPVLCTHAWYRFVHKVWVKIHQLWISTSWIKHPCKVQSLVILSASDATAWIKAKDLLEAFLIFDFHRVQSQSHRYHNEYALAFTDLLGYFVQEDISIVAYHHAKVLEWLHRFIYLVQHVADGLWAVPIARLSPIR